MSESRDIDTTDASNTPPILPHLQQQQQEQQHEQHKVDYEQEAKKLEDKAVRFLAKQAHPVVIPSFAAWFNFSDIHELEKKALPDFFDDSSRFKTPKVYKDVRDFLVNTYRLSPYEYLTVTAARRNIALDVASIVKIHSFLEKWGLINYQIDPRSKPSLLGPSFTGHFQVVLDTPQGLKPFVPTTLTSDKQNETEELAAEREEKSKPFPVNLSLRKNVYDSTQDFNSLTSTSQQSRQITKTYICHSCGNESVGIRYHNLRSRDTNVCSRCFQEGHFGAQFHSSDFIRLENNGASASRKWSDQELLLLFEAIEMYEDNWEKIVEHVGGQKSIEECVEKFLSLPIEDKYIDEILPQRVKGSDAPATLDTKDAVDATIKALLDGLNKDVLADAVPASAKQISEKYLKEAQLVVQDLCHLTLQKMDLKFNQLSELERSLQTEKEKYVKESEKLLNDRISLSKQVSDLNKDLAALNISKKLVLLSDHVDSGIKLVQNDEHETQPSEQLNKVVEQEINSISAVEPQLYKPWSL